MVNVFIQITKQFYNNALNDHNLRSSTKGWNPLTGSVLRSLSRGGSDSTGQLGVKGSVASGVKSLNPRATLPPSGIGNHRDSFGWAILKKILLLLLNQNTAQDQINRSIGMRRGQSWLRNSTRQKGDIKTSVLIQKGRWQEELQWPHLLFKNLNKER